MKYTTILVLLLLTSGCNFGNLKDATNNTVVIGNDNRTRTTLDESKTIYKETKNIITNIKNRHDLTYYYKDEIKVIQDSSELIYNDLTNKKLKPKKKEKRILDLKRQREKAKKLKDLLNSK